MPSIQKTAGTGSSVGSGVSWLNTSNITSSNNTYANTQISASTLETALLFASNFGFDIPAIATIDGVVCTTECKRGTEALVSATSAYIYRNGAVGDNKATTYDYWGTTDSNIVYGSPTDLWNLSWTPADVNNSSYGYVINAYYIGDPYSAVNVYVDSMQMTVYYTLAGIKFGATSVGRIYFGNTEIKSIYHGSTQVA